MFILEIVRWLPLVLSRYATFLWDPVDDYTTTDILFGDVLIQGVWGFVAGSLFVYIWNGPRIFPTALILGRPVKTMWYVLGSSSVWAVGMWMLEAFARYNTEVWNTGVAAFWGFRGVGYLYSLVLWRNDLNVWMSGFLPSIEWRLWYWGSLWTIEGVVLANNLGFLYLRDTFTQTMLAQSAVTVFLIVIGFYKWSGTFVPKPKPPRRQFWSKPIIEQQTWAALIVFVVVAYLMALTQIYIDAFIVRDDPLVDLIHSGVGLLNFPHLPGQIVMLWIIFTVGFVFLWVEHPQRIFRRSLWIMATLYALRTMTLPFTQFPNPFPSCVQEGATLLAQPLWNAILIMTGSKVSCNDCMFSGHTATLITCSAVWVVYAPSVRIKLMACFVAFVGATIIVVTRFHYTTDVIVSIIISTGVHALYYVSLVAIEHTSLEGEMWWPTKGLLRVIKWMDNYSFFLINDFTDVSTRAAKAYASLHSAATASSLARRVCMISAALHNINASFQSLPDFDLNDDI